MREPPLAQGVLRRSQNKQSEYYKITQKGQPIPKQINESDHRL